MSNINKVVETSLDKGTETIAQPNRLPSYTNDPDHFSLVDNSNFFSWISVSFLSKLIKTGGKRPLEEKDLGYSSVKMKPKALYAKFEVEWEKEMKKPPEKRNLIGAILRAYGYGYWSVAMILNIITIFLAFVPTIILNLFVSEIENDDVNMTTLWIYTIVLLVVPLITAYINSAVTVMMANIGVGMKSMASEAIYRKALKLTSTAKGSTSTGQLVNIMSNDTNSLLMFMMMITVLVMVPFMLVICVVLVAQLMGRLTWVAIGIYVLMIIVQFVVVGLSQPVRTNVMKTTDARVKLMNEVLTGIRVIKYYCWEKPFKGKIHDIRHQELKYHQKMTWMMSIGLDCMLTMVPNIVPMVCFALYPSVMGQRLTSSNAFTSLSLFKMLQMPFAMLPMIMMIFVEFNVSKKRITNFLNLDECDESIVEKNLPAGTKVSYKDINGNDKTVDDYDAEHDAVLIRDGYFAWGSNDNCLKNITTRIPKGSLVAVVGRVGSGKTSFVSTLVGEMTRNAGTVIVNGSMSLSAQQAWLVNETVKNNILFGKPFDEKKYKEILRVCCLEDDLKVLQGGDECEIGDRGINVSGGQKARISLARCCYSDSDIVVMDDPIAAVDSHVGKALFNKCIHKYMKGRTRILVTNATQYLHKCDYIIVLENQTIAHQGTYEELKAKNIDLMALLTEEDGSSSLAASRRSMHEKEEKNKLELKAEKAKSEMNHEDGSLTTTETKETGQISWKVYMYYFKKFSYALIIVVMICFIAASTFNAISQFELSDWSNDVTCDMNGTTPEQCTEITNKYIFDYSLYIILYCVLTVIRICIYIPGRIRAAQLMHDDLTNVILDAPVSFHDVTPVGRVLNRFNRDMGIIDFEMPRSLVQFLQQFFMLIVEIVCIVVSTRGLMAIVIVIAFIFYYFIQHNFRRANTDIQRIESLTRTPVFSDFQAVLNGSPSIRAYGHQARFISGIEKKLDRNNNCMLIYQWAQAWLSLRSDVIAALMNAAVGLVTILVLMFTEEGEESWLTPGLLGVALSACSSLSNFMKQMVRMLAQTEAQMNSVERVKEYVDVVKPEPPMITDVRPPAGWPSEGRIEMKNAKLRYRDGPLVMKGVNLSVNPHEKVGIVGRTGAGKSTMMIALFRITDLCEGSIEIDGIDLAKLGLEDVRRALCIIPQDPVLFSATVRFNIDPFNDATDEDIWSVLEQVELKDVIGNMPKKLDDDVQEGGTNFSVGERQLICMARALLKRPKILIMDEATASLDNETDAFLQQMIRKQFANCTTLTIAHRLNTIMDADRVCVMDSGVVAEYDSPYNLLHKNGIFKGMVLAANDPNLFDLVPGCEDMKKELEEFNTEKKRDPEGDGGNGSVQASTEVSVEKTNDSDAKN